MATGVTDDTGSTSTTTVADLLQSILEVSEAALIELRIANTYLQAIASGAPVSDDPETLRDDADTTDNLNNPNSLS